MDGLDAALERARRAYADEREMIRPGPDGKKRVGVRPDVAKVRHRLGKVSLARMASGRAPEMLAELDWWGIPRPRDVAEAERAMLEVLDRLEQDAGAPGDSALRAAGFELLSWWVEQGNTVTATKRGASAGAAGEDGAGDVDGNSFAPSATVAFLAEQLSHIVPELRTGDARRPGWTPALDAAYTIAQTWRSPSRRKPGGIS